MTAVAEQPASETKPVRRRTWLAFIAAGALYAVPAVWLLQNYLQPAFDLAIYDQTLWLINNGETFNTIIASHVFGVHFSPILLALSPISLVPGGAIPELVLQGLLIASGVFPAAKLAKNLDKSPTWFVAAYALHPAIIGGSWYGFRPWNIAVPVFMWVIVWIVARPTPARITASGLLMLVFREDLALWVGLAAIVLALAGRIPWKKLIGPGAVLGAASAAVLLGVLPILSPVEGYFFATSAETAVPSVATSTASVAVRALFLVIPLGVMPSKINWRLAAPLLVPILGLVFKGGNALSTFFHYDMMFVPVLLVVIGLSSEASSTPRTVALSSLVVLLLFGVLRPFPPQHGPNPWRYDADITAQLDRTMDVVRSLDRSESLSVSAPSRLIPHLSERSNVFIHPEPITRSDLDAQDQYQNAIRFDCPLPNIVVSDSSGRASWDPILSTDYRAVVVDADLTVWRHKKTLPDDPCRAIWYESG